MATSFSQNASKEDNEVSISDSHTNIENVCGDMKKQTFCPSMVLCTEEGNLSSDAIQDSLGTNKFVTYDFLGLPKSSCMERKVDLVVPISCENATICKEIDMPSNEPKFSSELLYATKKMTAKYRDKNSKCSTDESKFVMINENKTNSNLSDGEDSFQQLSLKNKQDPCDKQNSNNERDTLMKVDEYESCSDELETSKKIPVLKKAKSASDFLQKLVQEQKSQVPTLFCRELPALHSASRLYNTDYNPPSAKISLFGVPNCSSDPMFVGSLNTQESSVLVSAAKNPLVCSEESSNAKNSINITNSKKPTAQYDSISSDEEEKMCAKPKDLPFSPKEAATKSTVPETTFTDCSGKLRFYLDGRFVLELTHSAGSKGNTKGWVQSKGKIWRPTSQVTGRLTRTPCKKTQSESFYPSIAHTSFLNFLASSNSLSSLFMLRANKQTRTTCLCWLSRKELRHGARNPLVDLHEIYQSALKRNQPILSPSAFNISKGKIKNKRRKLSLNGLWKFLQKYNTNCNGLFSSSKEQTNDELAVQTDENVNNSLLLNALMKPKFKEQRQSDIPCETSETASRSPTSVQSNETSKVSHETSSECKINKIVVTAIKGTNYQLLCEKETNSLSAPGQSKNNDNVESVPNLSRTESCSLSSLLPLPEWYLDPSKAEVPISEMIGYPRPYFPPISNESRNNLTKKKRHAEGIQSKYPNSLIKKKFYLKDVLGNNALACGENPEANEGKYSENWMMWVPKVEQNIEPVSTASSQKLPVATDDFKDSEQVDHQELNSAYEQNNKIRCVKRFGSYGRGHAVNEAIRTFVISDIVNLGGDLESRYVPRGVYSEVASRYKIDVSTTTRWWLRYCADLEHLSKKKIPSSLINTKVNFQTDRFQKSETFISTSDSVEDVKHSSESHPNSQQIKEVYFYNSRSVVTKDEHYFENSINSPDLDSKRPLDHFQQSHEVENMVEDMPLDLRVKKSKIEEKNNEKLPYLLDEKHIHQLKTISHSAPSNVLLETNKITLCSESNDRNERKSLTVNPISSIKISSCEAVNNSSTPIFARHLDFSENSRQFNVPLHPSYNDNSTSAIFGDGTNRTSFNPMTPSCSTELKNDNSHLTGRILKSSELPFPSTMEYPLQNSALKPLINISSHQCVSRLQDDQIISQKQDDRSQIQSSKNSSLKENSFCSHDSGSNKSSCLGLNNVSKSTLPECPSFGVPLNSLHGNYARLGPPAPPSIALGPWPYAPCPLMTYGPTLVNSYYYCCCFLPGCRFHYIYGPDGQPIEPDETLTTSPSLLLANGYSKYCPPVAEISPVIFESIHQDHVYKSWNSTVQSSGMENKSPMKTSPKEENVPKVETDMAQNSESSGSMLKDLLLKPSRGTPEKLVCSPKHMPSSSEPILNSRPSSVDILAQNKSIIQTNSVANYTSDEDSVATVNHVIDLTHSRDKTMEIEYHKNILENVVTQNSISKTLVNKETLMEVKNEISNDHTSPKLHDENESPSS